jgi:hypothetical protein
MILFSVNINENGDPKYGYCNCLLCPHYDAVDDFSIDRAIVGKKGKSLFFLKSIKQEKFFVLSLKNQESYSSNIIKKTSVSWSFLA